MSLANVVCLRNTAEWALTTPTIAGTWALRVAAGLTPHTVPASHDSRLSLSRA